MKSVKEEVRWMINEQAWYHVADQFDIQIYYLACMKADGQVWDQVWDHVNE